MSRVRAVLWVLSCASLAALVTVGLAGPARGGVTEDAGFVNTAYHYGSYSLGAADYRGAAKQRYDDVTYAPTGLTGFGEIHKLNRVRSVQVDFVRLGIATGAGGVLAENLTPSNSGLTGASATLETTRWTLVRSSTECAEPFRIWVRVGYSARWADGKLSRWSVLGPRSHLEYCGV